MVVLHEVMCGLIRSRIEPSLPIWLAYILLEKRPDLGISQWLVLLFFTYLERHLGRQVIAGCEVKRNAKI